MKISTIDDKTMDSFVAQSAKSHFMQTSSWGKVAESRGQKAHMLGFYEGEQLLGTALLLEKKIVRWSSFYCPRGFICDYGNLNTVSEIIRLLKQYVKTRHGLYFRMDPDLLLHRLNEKAEVIETFPENEQLIAFLQKQGARWKGKTITFKEMSNPRFTFRVPLNGNEETLMNQCHPTTRNILKKDNPYPLKIHKGTKEEVALFYQTMKDTARNKSIYLEPYSFFEDFYSILHEQDMSDLWIAKIDRDELMACYQEKETSLNEELALCEAPEASKKQKAKKNDILDQLKKFAKEKEELIRIEEKEIVLSSVITAKYQDKVWIVHGGNSDRLRSLFANYRLYYEILKDGQKEGRLYGDLFGTEGKVDPKSDVYGIYLFKLRFGGDFDEFIGEFDFVTKPIMNRLVNSALHVRRRLLIAKSVKESKHESR